MSYRKCFSPKTMNPSRHSSWMLWHQRSAQAFSASAELDRQRSGLAGDLEHQEAVVEEEAIEKEEQKQDIDREVQGA
jgi:hypothetical protein